LCLGDADLPAWMLLDRWKLLDFALLKRSSVSFFDFEKQETAMSKWSRARTRVAKVHFLAELHVELLVSDTDGLE
jgi:hypothetical protein